MCFVLGLASIAACADSTSGLLSKTETPSADVILETEQVIEAADPKPKDKQIQNRIKGIFSELDNLKELSVTVNEGVVQLKGEVANEAQAQKALRLASRVAGVVTVQDSIERTLDVSDNVSPLLDKLTANTSKLIKALPLMLIALLVFLIVAGLGRFIGNRNRFWQRITPNPFVAEIISQAIKIIFLVLGLIAGLSLLGAQAIIGTLLGGAGVIGIAVGFAVRDSIENYISSIMLSIRQPFRAGDHVIINEHEGIVVRLTSRATILMTLDGNHLRIPNAQVFKGIILNYTTNPERRFDFELGVDANDDPVAAMKVGLAAIQSHDFILTEPKPAAVIETVGDSNIIISFTAWVNQSEADFFKARSLCIRSAKDALESSGFSLPEPIYRLRFDTGVTEGIVNTLSRQTAAKDGLPVSVSKKHTHAQNAAKHSQKLSAQTAASSSKYTDETAKLKPNKYLSGAEAAEVVDVKPDTHLQDRVHTERMSDGETDLLSETSPKE